MNLRFHSTRSISTYGDSTIRCLSTNSNSSRLSNEEATEAFADSNGIRYDNALSIKARVFLPGLRILRFSSSVNIPIPVIVSVFVVTSFFPFNH
ncbi:MAG: hypothetical protein K2H22_03165 [Muribaculaceae bacterium]|nr:hypothetical protein [Muribaculaceae bacterium]